MASVRLKTTPGAQVTAASIIDAALLNALASPRVDLEEGAGIGPEHLNLAALITAVGDTLRGVNFLPRPAFFPEDWRTPGGVTVPAGSTVENSLGWYAESAGAPVQYARIEDGPDAASAYAAQLIGASGVTETRLLAWVPAAIAGQLRSSDLTFAVQIENLTSGAASVTPILRTATSLNDRATAVTETDAGDATALTATGWTRIVWSFAAGDYATLKYGFYIGIKTAALDSSLKSIHAAQAQLTIGTTAPAWTRTMRWPLEQVEGMPSFFDGADRATGGYVLINLKNQSTRRVMPEPPADYVKPVLGWSRDGGGYPVWLDLGAQKTIFTYTGAGQTVTVPAGVTKMRAKLWGAGGGSDFVAGTGVEAHGGTGGYTYVEINVTPGDVYHVIVGAPGISSSGMGAGSGYGFGGDGRPGPGYFNSSGAGLTGVFTPGAAIVNTDTARAVGIAGGGAGGACTGAGVAYEYRGGNDAGATGANMSGASAAATSDGTSGGGAGYAGGGVGQGGKGFTDGAALSATITPGGSTVPNNTDPDYSGSYGAPGQPGLAVITFL